MSSNSYASALSTKESLNDALREVVDRVNQDLSGEIDLATVFFSGEFSFQAQEIADYLNQHLKARNTIGCSAESVIGTGREIEMQSAISLWAGHLPQTNVSGMWLQVEQSADGMAVTGWEEGLHEGWPENSTLLMLAEPFTLPADVVFERMNEDHPGVPIVGGNASAGHQAGQNQLIWNDQVLTSGAVSILLSGDATVRTVVSQGCRPIGEPFVITKAERNVIFELGGKAALLQLKQVFDRLANHEQQLVQQGLHVGKVVSEYREDFGQGDFLIRNVMGIQPDDGSIAIADWCRAGQTIQFHIRDAGTADHELKQLLAVVRDSQFQPQSSLVFSCNGRGTRLFPETDHDAKAVVEAFGEIPVAGFFAGGEFGPVTGKNFVHGFTASMALFQ